MNRRDAAGKPSKDGLQSPPPRSHRDSRWLYVALAIVVAAAFAATAAVVRTRFAPPALAGALLNPPIAAYDFHLTDQDGRPVSLTDYRGKVVVLTFLYVHCPDVCPLIADALHRAHSELGDSASKAAFLAVSVDPNGDTPDAVRTFLEAHRVRGELTYLVGTFDALAPVWAHYYVGSDVKKIDAAAPPGGTPTPDEVSHTAIVYVIDPSGKIRLFLPGNLDPKDLVADIRALTAR